MSFSPLITQLIGALQCLPSVGPKSAQRMVFHLLNNDRNTAINLSKVLKQAMQNIGHCEQCRTFCEENVCSLCLNQTRDNHSLCIVETPADVFALEQTGNFKGRYFVLMGRLSPIDGIGPEEIGIDKLTKKLDTGQFHEVILATNATVEGEATAYYISELTKERNISTSRIAHGVPLGGELEYLDEGTIARAFAARNPF
jgi:recombination protein RecR